MGLDQHAGWIKNDEPSIDDNKTEDKKDARWSVYESFGVNTSNVHVVGDKNTNVVPIKPDDTKEVTEFTWRKHARLQQFMMDLWYKRQGIDPSPVGMMDSFNCENLYLEEQDIHDLQQKILDNNLPFCPDGFFWGHQYQEESMAEYKMQDLDFCNQARKWLKEGKQVWYFCSW